MTIDDLVAELRDIFTDTSKFPDATLRRFVRGGIRWLGSVYSRLITADLALTSGTKTYTLPTHLESLSSLVYEDRDYNIVDRSSLEFERGEDTVAIIGSTSTSTGAVLRLEFRTAPTTSGNATIEYYERLIEPTDNITSLNITSTGHEASVAYASYKAMLLIEAAEASNPTTSTALLLSQFGDTTRKYFAHAKVLRKQAANEQVRGRPAIHAWNYNYDTISTRYRSSHT